MGEAMARTLELELPGTSNNVPADHDAAALAQRLERLRQAPIIAAVGSVELLPAALDSPVQALYLLTGTALNLPDLIQRTRAEGKLCMVNLDFIEGLARDRHAVEYLAQHGAEGIVSTKSDVLRSAKSLGMLTILRSFVIDSAAIAATLKSLSHFVPDAVEILPAAVAPKALSRLHPLFPGLHLIGGGLIWSVREIEALFAADIPSVSVSDPRLWVI